MRQEIAAQPLSDAIDQSRFLPDSLDVAVPPLPARYGEDRVVLLVRDPWCVFAYWESGTVTSWLEILRLDSGPGEHVVSGPFEVPGIGSYYFTSATPGGVYRARLRMGPERVLESAVVATPAVRSGGRPGNWDMSSSHSLMGGGR